MTRSRDVSKGATRNEFVYTATTQQTTFSGNDDNSQSLSYTVGQIDVFVNGVRQHPADYTATNGTSVVLGAGASNGDTVQINAFGTFSVANVLAQRTEFDYTATAAQTTFSGSDNSSNSLSYTAGRIDVYLNGSHLNDTDDYVATNGTSVVLQAGAEAGDLLKVVNHGTVNLVSNILSSDLDLNGNKLDLDADADTSIHCSTDDQIDIEIAGADDFTFTANDFTALSGSVISTDTINETTSGSGVTIDSVICKDGAIDVNGTSDGIILDADADTTISADTDDQVDIKIGGTDRFSIASTGKVTSTQTGGASNFEIQTTADSTLGADLTLYQNSASPADNDIISFISFAGNDSGDNKNTYAQIRGVANDVTDGTEDGFITFFTQVDGTLSEKMRITEDDVLIGSTSTNESERLHVAHVGGGVVSLMRTPNSGNTSIIIFRNANGNVGSVTTNGSSTAFNTSSDYRLKENVEYSFDATSRLKQLKPCRFEFKTDKGVVRDGFLAHEVSSIVPEAITGEKDATKVEDVYNDDGVKTGTQTVINAQSIDQSKLVPLLVKTIQELEARITALES